MRRLEIARYGPIRKAVRFAPAPLPQVGEHDVLLKVRAASVNPIDFKIAAGQLRAIQRLELPAPLGFDCSGIVEQVGTQVHSCKVGDSIYARLPRQRLGSFAEFAVVDQRYIAPIPQGLSFNEAASLPLVGLTTLQGLVDRAQARPSQSILIHAASGGFGSFAVQYARQVLGLQVTATTSSRNVEWVRELGAERIFAYDREDYRLAGLRFDIVLDTLGGRTTLDAFKVLAAGGTVVSIAGPPDRQFARQVGAGPLLSFSLWVVGSRMQHLARARGGRYFRFLTESDGAQLARVTQAVESGKVRPLLHKVFAFDQAIEALEEVERGHARGKVVIEL
jgi:NADPH:quinone reductase-like Zn-dependent oxidoreductase